MKEILVVAASMLAGFAGGVVGTRLTRPGESERPQPVIRARSFELVDGKGRAISIWGMNKQGHTLLAFLGSDSVPAESQEHSLGLDDPHKLRTTIGVMGALPFLTFRGSDGRARLDLYLGTWQKPLLLMRDEIGRPRVALGINQSDTPSATDDNWALSFEPNRAWIGMASRPEGGQRVVTGVFSISKDKVTLP